VPDWLCSCIEGDTPFGVGLGALLDHVALHLDEGAGDVKDPAVKVEVTPAQCA
jgi:hypothetical protein